MHSLWASRTAKEENRAYKLVWLQTIDHWNMWRRLDKVILGTSVQLLSSLRMYFMWKKIRKTLKTRNFPVTSFDVSILVVSWTVQLNSVYLVCVQIFLQWFLLPLFPSSTAWNTLLTNLAGNAVNDRSDQECCVWRCPVGIARPATTF